MLAQASVPLAVCTDTVLGLVGGAPGRRHLAMSKPALFQFVLKIGATNFDTSGKLPGPLLEPQLRLARGYLFGLAGALVTHLCYAQRSRVTTCNLSARGCRYSIDTQVHARCHWWAARAATPIPPCFRAAPSPTARRCTPDAARTYRGMVSKEEIVEIRNASLRRQQQRKRGETQPCLEKLINAADYVNDKFLVATDDDALDSAEKWTELKECCRVLCNAIEDRDDEVEKHDASLRAQLQKAKELCCAVDDLKKEAFAKLKEERAVTDKLKRDRDDWKRQEAERALRQRKADQAERTLLGDEFDAKLKEEVTEKTATLEGDRKHLQERVTQLQDEAATRSSQLASMRTSNSRLKNEEARLKALVMQLQNRAEAAEQLTTSARVIGRWRVISALAAANVARTDKAEAEAELARRVAQAEAEKATASDLNALRLTERTELDRAKTESLESRVLELETENAALTLRCARSEGKKNVLACTLVKTLQLELGEWDEEGRTRQECLSHRSSVALHAVLIRDHKASSPQKPLRSWEVLEKE